MAPHAQLAGACRVDFVDQGVHVDPFSSPRPRERVWCPGGTQNTLPAREGRGVVVLSGLALPRLAQPGPAVPSPACLACLDDTHRSDRVNASLERFKRGLNELLLLPHHALVLVQRRRDEQMPLVGLALVRVHLVHPHVG